MTARDQLEIIGPVEFYAEVPSLVSQAELRLPPDETFVR
jgi:hypothetical protein